MVAFSKIDLHTNGFMRFVTDRSAQQMDDNLTHAFENVELPQPLPCLQASTSLQCGLLSNPFGNDSDADNFNPGTILPFNTDCGYTTRPREPEPVIVWFCSECFDGPYGKWQVSCQKCQHPKCGYCKEVQA
jgi:hypothetical protein